LEMLQRVGIEVEVSPTAIDETPHLAERPSACALRLASEKAAVAAALLPGRWVLAADTVVEIDGVILGKPESAAEAGAMLRRLIGRTHRVTTAFSLRDPDGRRRDHHVTTEVDVRAAGEDELLAYLDTGEWRGKAGAYAVQGIAAALVTAVRGSITNVVGLPLAEVVDELRAAGAVTVDYRRGMPA
ncbi:MAG TPA: Maf family protein, partial [Kofleriaceae bacterium]|nr:Maf family protein [Kofleriaceae bacterium]